MFAWPNESVVLSSKHKNDPDVLAYYMADRQKGLLDLVPEVPAQLRALLGTQPTSPTGAPMNGAIKPAGTAAVASGVPPVAHAVPVAAPSPGCRPTR